MIIFPYCLTEQKFKTLAEAAVEKGWATGIITTTRLTHATPACFVAHNINRDNEDAIAEDFLKANIDFYAGGGFNYFVPKKGNLPSKRTDNKDLVKEFQKLGYKTFIGESSTESFMKFKPEGPTKVFAAFTESHLPYEIDRVHDGETTPSLAYLTEKGIEVLKQYNKPFFMMVEGGRIDHACHINDIHTTIIDTLAFDEAIKAAHEFYKKHPNETLIIVTADHETGGLGLGFAKNYFMKLDPIMKTKFSIADKYSSEYINDKEKFSKYIAENFGLTNLTPGEEKILEVAIKDQNNKVIDTVKYGEDDPTQIAIGRIIAARANIFWTTFAHTGTQLPLSAIGKDSEKFTGFKDNTDVPKTIAASMGVKLDTVDSK